MKFCQILPAQVLSDKHTKHFQNLKKISALSPPNKSRRIDAISPRPPRSVSGDRRTDRQTNRRTTPSRKSPACTSCWRELESKLFSVSSLRAQNCPSRYPAIMDRCCCWGRYTCTGLASLVPGSLHWLPVESPIHCVPFDAPNLETGQTASATPAYFHVTMSSVWDQTLKPTLSRKIRTKFAVGLYMVSFTLALYLPSTSVSSVFLVLYININIFCHIVFFTF